MSVQQDRSLYYARNVQPVREHGKKARTPLAAFFNIPEKTNLIWRVPTTQVGPNSKGGQKTISSPLFGRQFTASYCLSRAECFGKSKGKINYMFAGRGCTTPLFAFPFSIFRQALLRHPRHSIGDPSWHLSFPTFFIGNLSWFSMHKECGHGWINLLAEQTRLVLLLK